MSGKHVKQIPLKLSARSYPARLSHHVEFSPFWSNHSFMATVTYHIYSHNHHDPQRTEAQDLDCEEGNATIDDEWQQAVPRSNTLRHAAPYFVPAALSYEEWCSGT